MDCAGARAEPYLRIPSEESKITSAIWGPLDETVITGHANGMMIEWDAKTGEQRRKVRVRRRASDACFLRNLSAVSLYCHVVFDGVLKVIGSSMDSKFLTVSA